MKTSDIYSILIETDYQKTRNLFDSYQKEYEEYKKMLSIKGSSIHLKIIADKDFIFNNIHLHNLVELFKKNILIELELNFLVDSILASISSFENEKIENILENLTDPEINGPLTKESINRILGSH